jgi:hypothetical protein
VIAAILLLLTYLTWQVHHNNKVFTDTLSQETTLLDKTNASHGLWLSNVRRYGLFFGSSYLAVTLMIIFVYYYLFELLKNPFIKAAYPEYVANKT